MRRPPYLPFLSGPLSLHPGLKPIPPETWIWPDTEAHVLDEKHAVMRDHREAVFAQRPGSEAAVAELAAAAHAAAGPGKGTWPTTLERAASTVSDDFCVLMRDGDGLWRLEAASVAAPTFWRLEDTIGQPLSGLHAPVPGANPEMVGRIQRMFDAIQPGAVLERFNWNVQPGPERFTPSQAAFKAKADSMPAEGALEALWLRVERQTITKLPQTGAMVFSIRVAIDPLRAALPDATHLEAFRAAWDGISTSLAAYKGWPHYAHLVRAALNEAA